MTGIVVLVTSACTAARRPVPVSIGTGEPVPQLELLAALTIPSVPDRPTLDQATHFGSLSGLARDDRTGSYLAVIDDRGPTRAAWLDITFAAGRLDVRVLRVQPLIPGPGVDRRRVVNADLEALVALPDGTFMASEEGHIASIAGERVTWPPTLLHFTPDLVVSDLVSWPPRFQIGAEGVRDNQGAEGLALTQDGRLVGAIERPLGSDLAFTLRSGRPFSDGRAGLGRFVEFVPAGAAWQEGREWAYPIEATTVRPGTDGICNDGENGLSDLLAFGDGTFLSLERACLVSLITGAARNTASIYFVSTAGAEDVAALDRLDARRVRPAAKARILDLASLLPRLPDNLQTLENFECLAFGPTLPDGSRTLLVVSDDNFNATQKTAFLLFRLR